MATGARLEFEIGFGRGGSRQPRGPDSPFCVLVCADLSGGAATRALRDRPPLRVDADSLDRVFGRIAPKVRLGAGEAPVTIGLDSLEDFRPDRLVHRLDEFTTLRGLRRDLEDPASFERAAAALGAPPPPAPGTPERASADADIERLLGRRPQPEPSGPASAIERWVRELVAPHVLPDTSARKQALLAAVDATLAERMRAVLRDPAMRRLEASWRGVERMVSELGGDDPVELWLFDATRDEIAADLRAAAPDPAAGALWRLLCKPDGEQAHARPWALLAFDHDFGRDEDDVELLAGLAGIASRAGAALLGGADTRLLGCPAPAQLIDPAAWTPPDPQAQARWKALRASPPAASIGLATPRVLMRRPYGARSDPIEAFAFEEVTDPQDPEAWLWGCPALLLATLAGMAFREQGWDMDLDASLDAADLPAYSYRVEGESRLRPCAQALVSERVAEGILSAGIMPLMAWRDRNAVRLMRWQSIADPPQRLAGPWR